MLIRHSGWYRNGSGQQVYLEPNTNKVFDGLPWLVKTSPDKAWSYTCDNDGKIYPNNHPIYQDDGGWWQDDLFSHPRHVSSYDIVAIISKPY